MATRTSASAPPTEPIRNFEHNLARVKELMAIHTVLAPGPGKPQQWRSDVAAAAIVMTLAAVDTYFDDRLRADFESRFDALEPRLLARIISRMLVASDGAAVSADSSEMLARALQSGQPKSVVIQHFGSLVDTTTYQEPGVISRDIDLFGVSNIWGRVEHCWSQKFGEKKPVEKMFREWAARRHGIAHRSGRSRSHRGPPLTKARPGQNATRDEANDCIEFFRRLIALVDYQLNDSIYKKQPRARKSDTAFFDLQPIPRRPRRAASPLKGALTPVPSNGRRRPSPPAEEVPSREDTSPASHPKPPMPSFLDAAEAVLAEGREPRRPWDRDRWVPLPHGAERLRLLEALAARKPGFTFDAPESEKLLAAGAQAITEPWDGSRWA